MAAGDEDEEDDDDEVVSSLILIPLVQHTFYVQHAILIKHTSERINENILVKMLKRLSLHTMMHYPYDFLPFIYLLL